MPSISEDDILQWLINLGFNSREAKILFLLAKNKPMTAGEIANNLNIPKPHVYSTLQELLKKGLIEQVNERPKKYTNLEFSYKLDNILKEREKVNKHMLKKISNLSLNEISGSIIIQNRKIFTIEFLKTLKRAKIRIWLVTPTFSVVENDIERELSKVKNRVDVRIAISDIRYLRTFTESPSFIRYIQPPPPFIFSIVDDTLFFTPLLEHSTYLGFISTKNEIVSMYATYFDHIWKDDYVRTLYRLRMTTPKEY